MIFRVVALALAVVVAAACAPRVTEVEPAVCPSAAGPALAVILRDAATGATSPFFNVKVVARSETYSDSAVRNAILSESIEPKRSAVLMLMQHPGTYDVTVSAERYQTLQIRNVRTANNLQCRFYTDTVVANVIPG